jgi:hypothetical protein
MKTYPERYRSCCVTSSWKQQHLVKNGKPLLAYEGYLIARSDSHIKPGFEFKLDNMPLGKPHLLIYIYHMFYQYISLDESQQYN